MNADRSILPGRAIYRIAASLAVAVAVGTAIRFADHGSLERVMSVDATATITSLDSTPRSPQMTESEGAKLSRHIPRDAEVTVATLFGDPEAYAYAHELREWLLRNGYTHVRGVNEHGLAVPVSGQHVTQRGERYEIFIGSRE